MDNRFKTAALRLFLISALSAFCPSGFASDFYKLTVIAESGTQVGPDWRITAGSVGGINESGVVTWSADRFVNGVAERGILTGKVTGNVVTRSEIAIGPAVAAPSINKSGQVAYTTTIPNPTGPNNVSAVRIWDQGAVSDLCVAGQQPTPLLCFSETLSDSARGTYRRSASPIPFGIVAAVNLRSQETLVPEVNFPSFAPVISRDGRSAAWSGGAAGVTNRIVVAAPSVGGRADFLFPAGSHTLAGLSINDRAYTAYVALGGSSTMARRAVGVALVRAGTPSIVQVADNSNGQFLDFRESPSINNFNQVAFVAQLAGGGAALPWVGDLSAGAPIPVVVPGEVIALDGLVGAVLSNGFAPQSMNERGQIVFGVSFSRPGPGPTSGIRHAIVLADPLPGVSPGNPIMPAPGVPLPSGWRFVMNCNPAALCSGTNPRRRYIDPALAVGYAYQVEAPGPNFASVQIPAPLANGDETFQVEFNGQVAPLRAGEAFDFTMVVPGGVNTFRITGIDTSEALDPINPAAFVTGLTFVGDAATDFSVTMVPIVEDPDDTDRDGVPNATDLCPNTAPGATVDASGCSADQRDSDGDGVVDSIDQCPATPLGTPVNANGCSVAQLDSDGDGVPNTADACPNTASGATVDANGCSADQRDTDRDGVPDSIDQCPSTPPGSPVNVVGCAPSQLDADGDGVRDNLDRCPNTPAGAAVNANGCAASQLDSDGDGVSDATDRCPGTPAGTAVGVDGCPVQPPTARVCDVTGDNFIDYRDIRLILLAIGKPAIGASDPRDPNGNGKVDLIDAAICTSKCSRLLCLPPR